MGRAIRRKDPFVDTTVQGESMTASKVLLVGWDGATFDLLDPWIAQGRLPNLSQLIREGAHGRVRSVPNLNSGPAWTSVSTGLNPGKHGVYGLVGFAGDSYRIRPLNRFDRNGKTVWERLGEVGKKAVVINLPITYPAEPFDGVLVAGGDAPSSYSPGFTHPEGLLEETTPEVGPYILAARVDGLIRAGKKAEALDKLHRMIESRIRTATYLMNRRSWDLFMVLFTASDSAQHYFWEDLTGGPFRDAIPGVFGHLDEALGELLARVDDRTTTVLLSDHGFGWTQSGVRYLNSFLAELGLLRYDPRDRRRSRALRRAFVHLDKRLGDRTKEWLLGRFPRLYNRATAGLWTDDVDWSNTRAFSLAGSSQIWINLRGRQPRGIVSPGQEYDEIVGLIQQTLGEALDLGSGRRAVRAVHRRTDLYHGPFLDRAPDLFVEWTGVPVTSGLACYASGQPLVGRRTITRRRYLINGGHREMGVLVARGTPIKRDTEISGATLYDIAPTLLYLLDQPVPTSFDGRILTGAVDGRWLQTHAPRFVDEDQGSSSDLQFALSAESEEEVMARLRALGYVE